MTPSSVKTLDKCGFGWMRFTVGGVEKMMKLIGVDQLQNAQSRCADLGARVPLPRNANENADYLVAFRQFVGSGSHVPLGVNDVNSEGDWRDNDGNPAAFTNWNSGEPNNLGNEDYVHMMTADGLWNDHLATLTISIICERE